MGYREVEGAFRHDNRKVIFVGDFIDRGPEQQAGSSAKSGWIVGSMRGAEEGDHKGRPYAIGMM